MDVSANDALPPGKSLVMFDGYCNLCNGAVQFILKRDPNARFCFAALSSQTATRILSGHPEWTETDSLLLWQDGELYDRSSAVLRIARGLGGLWPVFGVFLVLPKHWRDALYGWVARHRYRWFGKRETCMIPEGDVSGRFFQ